MSRVVRHIKGRVVVRLLRLISLYARAKKLTTVMLLITPPSRAKKLGILRPRMAYKRIWTGASFSTSLLFPKTPLSLIKARHFERGLVSDQGSPHFDYVLSVLGVQGPDSASARLGYRNHHRRHDLVANENILTRKKRHFKV